MAFFSESAFEDGDEPGGPGGLLGPGQVDQMIRQAIQMCWMTLPKSRRNIDEIERQIRRVVDRALANLREDGAAFGFADDA